MPFSILAPIVHDIAEAVKNCFLQLYPGTAVLKRCKAEGFIKNPDFDNFFLRKELTSSRHYVAVMTPDFDEKGSCTKKRCLGEHL